MSERNQLPKTAGYLMLASVILAFLYFIGMLLVYFFQADIALRFTSHSEILDVQWVPVPEIILSILYIVYVVFLIVFYKSIYQLPHRDTIRNLSLIPLILTGVYLFSVNYVEIFLRVQTTRRLGAESVNEVAKYSIMSSSMSLLNPVFLLGRTLAAIAVSIVCYDLYCGRNRESNGLTGF